MDPNQVVGQPTERWVYLAPDWSAYNTTQKDRSWTHVKVRTVTFADGRQITYVLDENGNPVAPGGAPAASYQEAQPLGQISYDADQQRTYQQQQQQGQRQTDQSERRIVSVTYQGAGKDRKKVTKYETGPDKVEDDPDTSAQATTPHVEGTPRGDGTYDNTHPIVVNRDANGQQVGPSRELTGPEREQWEKDQNQAAGRGSYTNEQIQNNSKGTTTLKPDGKGGTVAVTTYPDGRAPTTQPVVGVPSEATSKYPQVKQDPTTGAWSGLTAGGQWEPIAGGPGIKQEGSAFTPEPGAPPLGVSPEDIVRGLQTYSGFLGQQVQLYQQTGGKQGISPADATAKMEQRVKIADETIKQQQNATSTATTLRGQDITDRGISAQVANSRLSAANSLYNQTVNSFIPQIKYLAPGKGGNMAAAMQATLQGGLDYARAFGGLQDAPPVGYQGFPSLDQIRQQSQVAINTAAQGGPRLFTVNPGASTQPPAAAAPQFDPGAAAASEAAAQASLSAANAAANPQPSSAPPPAVNPVSTAPIPAPQVAQPMLTPSVVNATTDTTHGLIDNLIQPPPAAAGPAPSPDSAPIFQPGPHPFVNPPAGEPGNNPALPVGMAPRFVQQARYGTAFDPHAAGADLAQRLGIAPEIMQAAIGGLYG